MTHSILLKEADQCVKCGMCLPHCPTYTLTQDEGDSPRGRISLIQATLNGYISANESDYHLDRCLSCLACESACPSGVNYGHLIDGIRTLKNSSWRSQASHYLISHAPYWPAINTLLWLYKFSGIKPLLRLVGGHQFRRIDNILPEDAKVGSWHELNGKLDLPNGRIGLFTGCAGRLIDRKGLSATIRILNQLGYEVIVPKQQGCCGALHQHAGEHKTSTHMSKINQAAFGNTKLDAIIYLASGCGAHLVKQPFDIPVLEITQFLNRCHWPDETLLAPIPQTVGLHTPCTLKNTLKLEDEPWQLLSRIPDIKLIPLKEIDCCGAAGSYLLEQPTLSDGLLSRAIEKTLPHDLSYLATSNSGCALHLRSGLRGEKIKPTVLHPVELIDMSMTGSIE